MDVLDVLKMGLAVIGMIWTVIEIGEWYFPNWKVVIYCQSHIRVMVIPAVVVMAGMCVWKWYQEKIITFPIGKVKVKIQAGDILHKEKGVTVVGINRQLNTKLDQIGEASIHRAVLDLYGQAQLDRAFEKGKETVGAGRLFFQEKLDGREFLFLCMSDLKGNSAASTTKELIQRALDDLFYNQDILRVPKGRVYFPILGTGESGSSMGKEETIQFMIERLWKFQRQVSEVSTVKIKEVEIVIYRKDFHDINWNQLKEWAGKIGQYCIDCPNYNI